MVILFYRTSLKPMEIRTIDLIRNTELLNQTTVDFLRKLLLRYPYYQTLRLLLLENLYKIHDTQFNEELRHSSPLLADRSVLFQLVEGDNYEIEPQASEEAEKAQPGDRTLLLIDEYLSDVPLEKTARKTATVDAAKDYASYLMQMDEEEEKTLYPTSAMVDEEDATPARRHRIVLTEKDDDEMQLPSDEEPQKEDFFTETLAQIYIRQHKYELALEIIRALSLNNPKKNSYFADQIRFLEKLILINKNKV